MTRWQKYELIALDEVGYVPRSEEHTSELQSLRHLVCRLLLDTRPSEIYTLSLHDALPISKQNNQVRRLMTRWQKYELIALDEVGYVPLADIGAEFLFQVISERAE